MDSSVSRRQLLDELRTFLPSIACREVIMACEGLKVARTGLRPREASRLQKLAASRGFALVVGADPVHPRRDRGKGGWCNGLRVQGRPPGFRNVYIATSDALARRALAAEVDGDESAFGEALAIPLCCRKFYEQNQARAEDDQNDFFPLSAEHLGQRPFAALNMGAQYFDASLLSHFPCSLVCEASLQLARQQAAILARYDADWLESMVSLLNRPTLYTEYEGVFLLRPLDVHGWADVSHDPVATMGTSKSRVARALARAVRVRGDGHGGLEVLQQAGGATVLRSRNLRFFAPLPTSGRELAS